jgi:DNA-binding MarR family transcriptional regulator
MSEVANAPPAETLDQLAVTLLQHASLLTRLVFRRSQMGVSRSEAGLLAKLEAGPQQITALAAHEGLAQPTITRVVENLETRGWVRRERGPEDRRVVRVFLTDDGRRTIDEVRARYRPLLRECLAALSAEQVADLDAATEAMASLINELQKEARG